LKALLLFDIDGTLIDTEGAGLKALERGLFNAFPDFTGQSFPPLDLGGATDGSVVAFLFNHFGIENNSSHCESFYRHYTAALENSLEENSSLGKGRILPGVRKLLPSLTSHFPEHVSALLTGNAKQGARIKLRHYELDKHFPFGAFGCDHPERNQLGPIAIERAQKSTGRTFDSEEVIVIGDTPKDIACARACGAKVLAVSTGTVPHEDLKKAEPDALLRDFSNLDETLSTLEGLFPGSSFR
jgi:phosphoglycolate phosphatase-like HAD superfamily hydrolase